MPLILRSTFASSGSRTYCDTDVGVEASAAPGWRWPTGAVQGLVVVSFPAIDGRNDGANAIASAVPRPTTTSSRRRGGADAIPRFPLGWSRAYAPGSWITACASPEVVIAVDRIATKPRIVFLVIECLHLAIIAHKRF